MSGGIVIEFAGIACAASSALYRETVGLEPNIATVRLSSSQLEPGVEFAEAVQLLDRPLQLLTIDVPPYIDVPRLNNPERERAPTIRSIPQVGMLTIAEVRDDGTIHRIDARSMFVSEYRKISPVRDPYEVELVLQSVAGHMDTHGELTMRANIRTTDGRLDESTLGPDGKPQTLRRLFREVLKACPGRPALRDFPAAREPSQPVEVRATAANPKDVLRGLLHAAGLLITWHRDRSASIYAPGEGTVGERPDQSGGGNTNAYNPKTGKGAWEGEVDPEQNLYARRYSPNPNLVQVACNYTISTVRVDYWTPVVPIDVTDRKTGKVSVEYIEVTRPWLINMGFPSDFPDEFLLALPFVPFHQLPLSAFPSVDPALMRRLQSSLFRYWAIPTPMERLLPILDRAERYPDGTRKPPLVEGFGYSQILADITNDVDKLTEDKRTPEEVQLGYVEGELERTRAELDRVDWFEVGDLRALIAKAGGTLSLIVDLRHVVPQESGESISDVIAAIGDPVEGLKALMNGGTAIPAVDRPTLQVLSALFRTYRDALVPLSGFAAAGAQLAEDAVLVINVRDEIPSVTTIPGEVYDKLGETSGRHRRDLRYVNGEPVLTIEATTGDLFATDKGAGRRYFAGVDPAETADAGSAAGSASGTDLLDKLQRSLLNFGLIAAGELIGIDDKSALDVDRPLREQLRSRVEQLKKERIKLLREIHPVAGAQAAIRAKEEELQKSELASGKTNDRLRAELVKLRADLEKARLEEAKREMEKRRPILAPILANNPRRAVEHRWVDRERGILAVTEPTPPVWLRDPTAPTPAATYALAMPLAVTFGTLNDAPPIDPNGEEASKALEIAGGNYYVKASVLAFARMQNELGFMLRDIGHILPDTVGRHQLRFGFSFIDEGGGTDEAPVGLVADADEGLQDIPRDEGYRITLDRSLLVELPSAGGPQTNIAELRGLARDRAQSVLFLPGALDAGSLTVAGPRPVNTNGRISAVEVSVRDGIAQTLVSFDAPEYPVPDVRFESTKPGGYVSLSFGLQEPR